MHVQTGAKTRFFLITSLIALSPYAHAGSQSPAQAPDFWTIWGDGKAEVAGYTLKVNRYGEERSGQAVTIFVTETFEHKRHVKIDRKTDGLQYPVMKLNLIRDFQTGIYDYNTMISVFVSLEDSPELSRGSPSKISFSSQEWCGHVYHHLRFEKNQAHETIHSYFDSEADQTRTIPIPPEAITEDSLWHWARGLSGPRLKRGQTLSRPLLPSLFRARLAHRAISPTRVTLSRSPKPYTMRSQGASVEVEAFTATIDGGPTWKFEVSTKSPHQILQWSNDRGESATLRGAKRIAYWKLNGPGGQGALKELGILPLP